MNVMFWNAADCFSNIWKWTKEESEFEVEWNKCFDTFNQTRETHYNVLCKYIK